MTRTALRRWAPALFAFACAAAPLPADEGAPASPPAAWTKTCSLCHGKGGRPNASLARKGVRDLTDPAWQARTSDESIAETIRKGRPGTLMGSYEARLAPEEIEALVRFIRTLKPPAEPTPAPPPG